MNRNRSQNKPLLWQAGALSLLVHGVFLALLVMSFSWKAHQPMQVMSVELWESLPAPKPDPVIAPKPEPVIEPEPAPPPPPPEPKAEIQVKAKPLVKLKPETKPKPKPKEVPKADPKLKAQEAAKQLEELKRAMLADTDPVHTQNQEAQQIAAAKNAQAQAIASSGVLDAAKMKIVAKIRRYVNPQACGNGKPVVEFGIALMPTGEVIGAPHLIKGSGMPACDQAVERAILQAQPLPLPADPELFSHFRDLDLKFRPNENS